MVRRRLVFVSLLLLGLAVATQEDSFVHTDDGCVVETHCNACLLRMGAPGVVTVALSLPRVAAAVHRVAPALPPSYENAAPRGVPPRGPPSV